MKSTSTVYTIFAIILIAILGCQPNKPEPVSNMTQSDSIAMLQVEIQQKDAVIEEQTRALKACDELTEQLLKGL